MAFIFSARQIKPLQMDLATALFVRRREKNQTKMKTELFAMIKLVHIVGYAMQQTYAYSIFPLLFFGFGSSRKKANYH